MLDPFARPFASGEELVIGNFELAQSVVEWIEVLAIVVITIGVIIAIVGAAADVTRSRSERALATFKRHFARGLLIGLDLLIAADVIKTVTLEATIENGVVLGILVLIRTFLSWTLILEFEGRWPWQRGLSPNSAGGE